MIQKNYHPYSVSPAKEGEACPAPDVTPQADGSRVKIKTKNRKSRCKKSVGQKIWGGVKKAAAIGLAATVVGAIIKGKKKK